ncbi:leucine-rich repeat domain-containing protein [Cytophagaceae bacterium ABcell3]|nr:leucine-rich repeat domain-containing protein [Cytophagaceae bacterium ABcell3]
MSAIGEFTNAISLKPDFAEAYYHRAYAKDLLGKKMGFMSTELCADFVEALRLGKLESAAKLERACMGECYPLSTALKDPENVYCADFSEKELSDLPEGAEKLVFLVKLDINDNNITTLSDNFGKLPNLVSLDLSKNKLENITPVIGELANLRELSLNKNRIKSLPAEFGNLKHLKTLNLRQNGLTDLPRTIAMLSSLENLDLALNQLEKLPVEIANLKNLRTLTLVGNDIPKKEQEKIINLLPNTTIYFE